MPEDLFPVTRVDKARLVEVALPSSLDSAEFDRINESLIGRINSEPHENWVLDLSQLAYMGSAALGLMVNVRQQIKQGGGKLVLCGMSPRLQQIFKTCCMERLFVIKPTRGDALEWLKK